jgi:hypothetical protein
MKTQILIGGYKKILAMLASTPISNSAMLSMAN